MPTDFIACPHQDALVREALRQILAGVERAPGGQASVVLSGGRTPDALYRHLDTLGAEEDAHAGIDAAAWAAFMASAFFWGDERWVPLADPQNNAGAAWRGWLSRAGIPQEHIHPIPTDVADPSEAVARVEAAWDRYFAAHPEKGGRPDVVVLGMGADGHTASLFPGQALDGAGGARAMVARHPETGAERVTLTLSFLNTARTVLFLVSGAEKAGMLRRVWGQAARLRGRAPGADGTEAWGGDPGVLPAARIHPTEGRLIWLYDAEGLDPPAVNLRDA